MKFQQQVWLQHPQPLPLLLQQPHHLIQSLQHPHAPAPTISEYKSYIALIILINLHDLSYLTFLCSHNLLKGSIIWFFPHSTSFLNAVATSLRTCERGITFPTGNTKMLYYPNEIIFCQFITIFYPLSLVYYQINCYIEKLK